MALLKATVLVAQVSDEDVHEHNGDDEGAEEDGNAAERNLKGVVIDSPENGPVVHVAENIYFIERRVEGVEHDAGGHVEEDDN